MVFRTLSLKSFRMIQKQYPARAASSPLIISNKMKRYHHVQSIHGTGVQPQADSDPKNQTIQMLTDELAKNLGIGFRYTGVKQQDRSHLTQYLVKNQTDLPKRSMRDSFLVAYIPLKTDAQLQDKYISFLGAVRVGRLLEDMDIFAVMVATKHILLPHLPPNTPMPMSFVTALVDRIDFTDFIPKPDEDIKISGHVSWVGKSSMEIVVWLEQQQHSTWHRITRALFLIAAREPTQKNSAIVNGLEPADDREKQILAGGETRKKNRMALVKKHIGKMLPDQTEQQLIHDLYLRTKPANDVSLKAIELPAGGVWMENCRVSTTIFSQPENRNFNNTVFGGFIMRQAVELSWVLAYQFGKYRPKLNHISDITFAKPIAVNSLIKMRAYVVYTHMQHIQITVYVHAFDPNTGKTDTTNTVHFTYEVPDMVKEVYPRTYEEAMMYIDGRRHYLEVMNATDDPQLSESPNSKL